MLSPEEEVFNLLIKTRGRHKVSATNFCQSEFREQETGRLRKPSWLQIREVSVISSRLLPPPSQLGVPPRPCCALTPPTRLSSVAYSIHIPAAESLDSSHSFRWVIRSTSARLHLYFIHTFKVPKVIMFGCNVTLNTWYVILSLYDKHHTRRCLQRVGQSCSGRSRGNTQRLIRFCSDPTEMTL